MASPLGSANLGHCFSIPQRDSFLLIEGRFPSSSLSSGVSDGVLHLNMNGQVVAIVASLEG